MRSFVNRCQSRQSRKRANALMPGLGKTPSSPVAPRSPANGHPPAPGARKPATAPFRASQSLSAQRSEAVSERSERGPAVDREVGGPVAGADLDTTAQPCQSPAVTTLQKRARSKLLTTKLASGLERLHSPMKNAYRNTLQCGAVLHQEMGRVQGKYCGNRWCLVCNRIRTAKLLKVYGPIMRQWEDAHFLTLTVPNVPAEKLHDAVREMLAVMPKIARAVRRTDGIELRAIRKLETTYSRRKDYHPHLHLIVDSRAAAEAMLRRWLERFPDATAKGQDIRKCDDHSVVELFKYFTKLTVKGMDGQHTAPPPHALDRIFKAVKGLRTFQAMGFTAPKAAVAAEDETILLDAGTESPSPRTGDVVDWEWVDALTDWVDFGTGEMLSGYQPSAVMQELLARIERDWATTLSSG